MPTYVDLHSRVHLGHLDLTGLCEQYAFGDLEIAKVPFTNFASAGFPEFKPGLKSGELAATLHQDHAAGVLDDQLGVAALGASWPVSVAPNPSATDAAGDPVWFSRCTLSKYSPLQGKVGDAANAQISAAYNTVFLPGRIGHAKAARTANGSGTAVALAGPAAGQRLYAALHVFAFSGFTTVAVKVQSDDSSGMGSPTDRLTFASVTGAGSEFASAAGGWATETHHRVTWTVTGTGSITFAVHIGVL